MNKKVIAFICVHNSCRSQIAEALGRYLLSDKFSCYSAGTVFKDKINQDAVRLIKELYGIDMEKQGQKSRDRKASSLKTSLHQILQSQWAVMCLVLL